MDTELGSDEAARWVEEIFTQALKEGAYQLRAIVEDSTGGNPFFESLFRWNGYYCNNDMSRFNEGKRLIGDIQGLTGPR